MDKRMTLALETLSAIEEAGISADELRKAGAALTSLAETMDALAWLDEDGE